MDQAGIVLVVTFAALLVSSTAGYGGSLVLVPALSLVLGPKEGIALAALLLAWNNVAKLVAYRQTIPLRRGWPLAAVTLVSVTVGSQVLIHAPDRLVWVAIVVVTAASFLVEVSGRRLEARPGRAVGLMVWAGLASGTSGSSGPLKGVALRAMRWPRMEHVGMASAVSFVGDTAKAGLFAEAGLLPEMSLLVLAAALPMMPVAAFCGRYVNEHLLDDERFRWVFWTVVGGYTLRMVGVWF